VLRICGRVGGRSRQRAAEDRCCGRRHISRDSLQQHHQVPKAYDLCLHMSCGVIRAQGNFPHGCNLQIVHSMAYWCARKKEAHPKGHSGIC
jgi:hypothetical protein